MDEQPINQTFFNDHDMHFPIIWGSLNLITLALASLAASASAAIARWSWTGSRTSLLQTLNFKIIKINRFCPNFYIILFLRKRVI